MIFFFNKIITIDSIGIKNIGRKNQNGKTIFDIRDYNINDNDNI